MANRKEWKDMTKKEKTAGVITALGILGIILWIFIGAATSETKPEGPKPSYEASIINYGVVDPATLKAHVKVKNISNVEGKPSCTVNASNNGGAYHGFDIFSTSETLQPGNEVAFNGNITITNEGANYITNVTVECS